jgi:hypothetical protein
VQQGKQEREREGIVVAVVVVVSFSLHLLLLFKGYVVERQSNLPIMVSRS